MKRLALLTAAVLMLSACQSAPPTEVAEVSTPTPDECSPDSEHIEALRDVEERFADAVSLAGSTPRISLSEPIANLQEIRRDAEDLEVPSCLEDAHAQLIEYMDAYVEAYLSFLSDADDAIVQVLFRMGDTAYNEYAAELNALGSDLELIPTAVVELPFDEMLFVPSGWSVDIYEGDIRPRIPSSVRDGVINAYYLETEAPGLGNGGGEALVMEFGSAEAASAAFEDLYTSGNGANTEIRDRTTTGGTHIGIKKTEQNTVTIDRILVQACRILIDYNFTSSDNNLPNTTISEISTKTADAIEELGCP
jgi:hypothetical protein